MTSGAMNLSGAMRSADQSAPNRAKRETRAEVERADRDDPQDPQHDQTIAAVAATGLSPPDTA
jgi:hypothetical protein